MAKFFRTDDTSDDDFSDNLKLTERLRINRDSKINYQKKPSCMDDQSSSSSSLEVHNDLHKPGTSRGYSSHNKKRQNGDKNTDLLANPKRTCLSNRFPRSECQNKIKKASAKPTYTPATDSSQFYVDPNPPRQNLYPDITYEDFSASYRVFKSYNALKEEHEKRLGLNNVDGLSTKGEGMNCSTSNISESHKKNPQLAFPKSVSSARNPNKQSFRTQNNLIEHSKSARNRTVETVSPISSHLPESCKSPSTSAAGNSVVHFVDSASDEDSRPILRNGSLKGGRQSPEVLQNTKKVIGRKGKKKVLDSDDETDDERDWLATPNRSRPRLIFSSSDSEVETSTRKVIQKVPPAKNDPQPQNGASSSNNELQPCLPACYQVDQSDVFIPGLNPNNTISYPLRTYRHRNHNSNNAALDLSSTGSFHYNRSPTNIVRGRNRVNIGERFTRRSNSPHPRTLPNSLPRMTRTDVSKSVKGRSLTGTRAQRSNVTLATNYPDIFDAEDSSEVEFFTANSYSDTETSAESFGGLRISTTVRNPTNGVICEHSVNVGSSEDEISVVFSTGPQTNESRTEGQVSRNGEQRRGSRTMGRRRQRGSLRRFRDNAQEVVSLSPDPVEQVRQVENDERFARMLQAEFDAEVDPSYVPRVTSSPPVTFSPYRVGVNTTSTDDTDNELTDPHEFHLNVGSIDILNPRYTVSHRTNRLPSDFASSILGNIAYSNRRAQRVRRRRRQQIDTRDIIRALETNWMNAAEFFPSEDSYETFLGIAELNGDVSRGLSRVDISRLPTRIYTTTNSENSELPHKRAGLNKECQVCLSDYENGDTLRILPCFHEFHTPCIDPWLKTNNTCPVCRVIVDLDG